MRMNVVDVDGEWFVNTALFRFVDSSVEGKAPVVFEPGVPTKAVKTEWMAGQELIVACPDPMSSKDPIPPVITPGANTLVPTDEVTGKPDATQAPGIKGTAADPTATPKRK